MHTNSLTSLNQPDRLLFPFILQVVKFQSQLEQEEKEEEKEGTHNTYSSLNIKSACEVQLERLRLADKKGAFDNKPAHGGKNSRKSIVVT